MAQSFEVRSRECLIRGRHATGLKPDSRQELLLFISSPRLQQNVCFGVCAPQKASKSSRQAPGMAEWLSPFKSRWEGLSNRRSADLCSQSSAPFFNWEL